MVCALLSILFWTGPAKAQTSWIGGFAPVTVQFGGQPYCTYTVSLTHGRIGIEAPSTTAPARVGMSYFATEATVGPCPNQPIPANGHSFRGQGTLSSDGVIQAVMQPAPANQPQANALFRGQITPDGRVVGQLFVTRSDITGRLAWSVRIPIDIPLAH